MSDARGRGRLPLAVPFCKQRSPARLRPSRLGIRYLREIRCSRLANLPAFSENLGEVRDEAIQVGGRPHARAEKFETRALCEIRAGRAFEAESEDLVSVQGEAISREVPEAGEPPFSDRFPRLPLTRARQRAGDLVEEKGPHRLDPDRTEFANLRDLVRRRLGKMAQVPKAGLSQARPQRRREEAATVSGCRETLDRVLGQVLEQGQPRAGLGQEALGLGGGE